MNLRSYAVSGMLLACCMASVGVPAEAPDSVLVTEALSPPTRDLLIREMQELAVAMGRIHRAKVTGEHQVVASEAKAVHDSFVLAQHLKESQRQEIREKLPPAFVMADQQFHELAARLMGAAMDKDVHLERFWFDEMTRACLACHRTFAGKRFAGLEVGYGHQPDGVDP